MGFLRDQIGQWNYGQVKGEIPAQTPVDPSTQQPSTNLHAEVDAAHVSRKMQASFYEAKVKLHQKLLSRLDLAAAETMSSEQLGLKLKDLINKLIDEDALPVNNDERHQLISDLQNEILGLGPIEPLLADPTVTEILVNGYDKVFIERRGQLELVPIQLTSLARWQMRACPMGHVLMQLFRRLRSMAQRFLFAVFQWSLSRLTI
jgi:pilus assembly protein CpaF